MPTRTKEGPVNEYVFFDEKDKLLMKCNLMAKLEKDFLKKHSNKEFVIKCANSPFVVMHPRFSWPAVIVTFHLDNCEYVLLADDIAWSRLAHSLLIDSNQRTRMIYGYVFF